jgi:hypothetical protein
VSVLLTPRQRNFLPTGGWNSGRVDRRTGEFVLRGVLPGSYDIRALVRGRDQLYAVYPIDLGAESVEGVILELAPGSTAAGVVSFDGELPAEEAPKGLTVDLRATESWYGGDRSRVEDGAFELDNLAPGTYNLRVSGMPQGAYLKTVSLNGQDLGATGVPVPQGGIEGLEVLIGLKGASVTGIVTNENGDPLPGATVVLLPAGERLHREDLNKSVASDQSGLFTFTGVAPGEYDLYAFEFIESGAWRDPDHMEPHADAAVDVKLDEGARQVIELTAIPEPAQ